MIMDGLWNEKISWGERDGSFLTVSVCMYVCDFGVIADEWSINDNVVGI